MIPRLDHPSFISGTINEHPDLPTDLRYLLAQVGVQLPIYRKTDNVSLPHTTLEGLQAELTRLDNVSLGAPFIDLRVPFDSKGAWIDGQMSLVQIRTGGSWKSTGIVQDLYLTNFLPVPEPMVLGGDYSRCNIGGHVSILNQVRLLAGSDMNLGKIVAAPGSSSSKIIVGLGCTFRTTDPLPADVELVYEGKVAVRTGNVLRFDQDAEYQPLYSGTFTVNASGKAVGAVVVAYLGPATTAPTLPVGFQLVAGAYASGKDLMYCFKVGANGKIQYTITELPA